MARLRNPEIEPMSDLVLAINAGSSSLKFGLFSINANRSVAEEMRGGYVNLGKGAHFSVKDTQGQILTDEELGVVDAPEIFDHLLKWLSQKHNIDNIIAAGHRIVHGGETFVAPVHLNDDVVVALEALRPLAPLHQPMSLTPVCVLGRLRPNLRQIGCFDTAFHHHLKPPVNRYPIPAAYENAGIRKYGFHGLSYEYIADHLRKTAPEILGKRLVVAHLGSGSSLCAMHNGVSIDTTMGYTPLDGLMMGTRSGSIDPGIILHLCREGNMSTDDIEHLLYHESGLLGVSGISGDVRDLVMSDKPEARAAIELFVFRAAKEIAAMAVSLEGLEGIVFTGGIGEHSPEIREMICARLKWLNVKLNPVANEANETSIGAEESSVEIMMVSTNEEIAIARNVIAPVRAGQPFPQTMEIESKLVRK